MKHLFTILLLLVVLLPAQAQKEIRKIWYSKDPKGMKFIPPGSFNYDDGSGKKTTTIQGFWISNEITNKEFREFYEDIKANPDSSFMWYDLKNKNEDGSYGIVCEKYSEVVDELIDETFWSAIPGFENYFTSKVFDNFPVTCVSYKSAQYFCWWKSKNDNQKNKNRLYLNEYRLPHRAEWEYAAYSGSTIEQTTGQSCENPKKIKTGIPVNFGLYNMFDNAAEFVTTDNGDGAMVILFSWENANPEKDVKTVEKNYRDKITGFRIVRTFIGKKRGFTESQMNKNVKEKRGSNLCPRFFHD